jgi:hypothetical protein
VAALHRLVVGLCCLSVLAEARVGFAEIVFGSFLARLDASGEFEARQSLVRLAGAKQVNAQQKIREVVIRLKPAGALKHCLSSAWNWFSLEACPCAARHAETPNSAMMRIPVPVGMWFGMLRQR